MSREETEELGLLVRAGWRVVAFESFEEERALRVLGKVAAATKRTLRTWSRTAGFEPDGAGAGSLDACVQAMAGEPDFITLLRNRRAPSLMVSHTQAACHRSATR